MSDKKAYNFSNFISNAQKEVKEFVHEKELLNSKLKTLILNLQSIDSKIYNDLFNAREFYTEKRYKYNIKIENLRRKKYQSERNWNSLNKKMKSLTKPELDLNVLTSIEYTNRSLEDIENKIINLTEKLEEQILDIDEENEILEKLKELESNKLKKDNLLTELKRKQAIKLQNSNYYITKKEKEALEKDLREIYEDLINLSNKRLMTHKKMFELYRMVREFENAKKQIEKELLDNKSNAVDYHLLFLKLMNLNKKLLFEEFSNKEMNKARTRKIPKSKIKTIITKKRNLKRFEQKKLRIALNKQKTGKKLDFYELQLILKHSKD